MHVKKSTREAMTDENSGNLKVRITSGGPVGLLSARPIPARFRQPFAGLRAIEAHIPQLPVAEASQ